MSQEERLQVLKMVQEGKVTAEEAARLLQAVDAPGGKTEAPGQPARWLRIKVTDTHSGKVKVNINLPAGLLSWAMRFVPQGTGLEEQVAELLREGGVGKIIDVQEDDEHVEISLE